MPAKTIAKGIIQTVLGNGEHGCSGDGGPAISAACADPYMCAFDGQGNMLVCMGQDHRIRRMDARTGIITTVAGAGEAGYTGDGGPARQATFNMPYALTVDTNGDIYVAERRNCTVRKVDGKTGVASTIAGTGVLGYSGDGGPGHLAQMREPNDVWLDGQGGLLIADIQDQRIRRVDLKTGIITTFAGTGQNSRAGDGQRATQASLMGPRAVCMDKLGNTYICEREGNGVRKVDAKGILTTIAGGKAERGYSGDGGPENNIIVVDTENNAVRRISARTGIVTNIAGGREGGEGDGGPATAAGLARPHGCGVDAAGNLYIADTHNHRVRVVGL